MEGYLALIKEQREENDKLQQEIKRLNNIINELENYLYGRRLTDIDGKTMVNMILDKLKELKERNNK